MNTRVLKTRMLGGLMAAAACFAALPSPAQELIGEQAAKFNVYEAAIMAADPAAAKAFLEDSVFLAQTKSAAPEKTAMLTAKALAVKDLAELLNKTWRDDQESALSLALAARIDFNKPLEKVGIGASPETLLPWMDKYIKSTPKKMELIKRSIRQWDVVFGTNSTAGKRSWEQTTIRERNAFLSDKASKSLEELINNSTRTDQAFQNKIRDGELFRYLDPAGRNRYERYLTQLAAAEAAKAGLNPGQLDTIKGQPIEQQLYLLGNLFDKSTDKGSVPIERGVDGARQSQPKETLSFQNNRLLAGMLQTAVVREVKGTASGDKVLAFYAAGNKLAIAIESCQGCYAKYEPSTGNIVLDSEMIQQYLRVNNLTADNLLRDQAAIASLAKYVSPMFVHEASHQMQHGWADKAGVYKPYVQEDEIESNSMEALYTIEKLKKDARFKDLFSKMRGVSTYAGQRLALAQRFNRSPDNFGENIRQLYYYGLPSFDGASSQILSAISSELDRRKKLDASELNELERSGVPLGEALAMTVPELTGSASDIQTEALVKIRADLMNGGFYGERYETSAAWSETTLGAILKPRPAANGVPAL